MRPENLPKEGPRQVAFGQLQDEVPGMSDGAGGCARSEDQSGVARSARSDRGARPTRRGSNSPTSEVTVSAAELDAKLRIEREANRIRCRVTHGVVPSASARSRREPRFLAGVERLWPGPLASQNEDVAEIVFAE